METLAQDWSSLIEKCNMDDWWPSEPDAQLHMLQDGLQRNLRQDSDGTDDL